MNCPECNGEGGWHESICSPADLFEECVMCDGEGVISLGEWLSYQFWTNAPVRFVEWYSDWRYPLEE